MYFLFNCFVKITGWIPYIILLRPKVYFENNKVQSRRIKGKAIVISNHTDVLDFAVMLFTFPGRTLRCVVAELMYKKNIVMTLLLRLFGTIKVDRTSNDFAFLSSCEKVLANGGIVEIYPESRLPAEGEPTPLDFKPSAVYLALQTNTPIIPVCNNGRFFHKERMRVYVGTPIDTRELYDESLSEKENISNITVYVREKIIEFKQKLEQIEKEEEK